MTTPPPSYVRQNYHPDCEALVNNQINLELHASYEYLFMAAYFRGNEVALKHLGRFFLQRSHTKREQADRLVQLQNQRGGRVRLRDIIMPHNGCWEDVFKAMEFALKMEKGLNQRLLELHELARKKKDAHLCYFLEHHCLREQVESISELGDHLANLRQVGAPASGLAVYLFDKLTLGHSDRKK